MVCLGEVVSGMASYGKAGRARQGPVGLGVYGWVRFGRQG